MREETQWPDARQSTPIRGPPHWDSTKPNSSKASIGCSSVADKTRSTPTADMTLDDVVRLNVYTTDIDELINQHFPKITSRIGDSRYATTILGVDHLPAQFQVMLEATAVD